VEIVDWAASHGMQGDFRFIDNYKCFSFNLEIFLW
jgi:hypothetical protein